MSRRARADLGMLATVRRVLTTFPMVDDNDSFTEVGFAFQSGDGAGKDPTGGGGVKIFSPLLSDQTGIYRNVDLSHASNLSQTVTRAG